MSEQQWLADGRKWGWAPPPRSPAWKRLPVIRHLRFLKHAVLASFWYAVGPGSIGIPTGYDAWGLEGMRKGYW